jgi:hypothetical protein
MLFIASSCLMFNFIPKCSVKLTERLINSGNLFNFNIFIDSEHSLTLISP